MNPQRGYAALRRYRVSLPNAQYFLTLCSKERKVGLSSEPIAAAIHTELTAIERDAHWGLMGAVIMPDHLHLLIRLTESMTLDRAIARLKSRTRVALSSLQLAWQGNFYEHRLRPEDSIEDILRYLHLNPYRSKLISADETWPWFWLGETESAWFKPMLDDGRPFPEWLA